MPINNESLQDQLYNFLKTQGFRPVRLNSAGKPVPLSKMADVFKFNFKMDDVDYGQVYAAVIEKNVIVWVEDDVLSSPNHGKDEVEDEMLQFDGTLSEFYYYIYNKKKQNGN